MKNIHVLPTNKPSRLYLNTGEWFFENDYSLSVDECINQNIYITSDENAYPYALHLKNQEVLKIKAVGEKSGELYHDKGFSYPEECKKIILTTDQDLIKDGVQAIFDDFLEWFVKNQSCDKIYFNKIESFDFEMDKYVYDYKIVIPKEVDVLELGQIIPKEEPYSKVQQKSLELNKKFAENSDLEKIMFEFDEPKQKTIEEAKAQAWIDFAMLNDDVKMYSFVGGFEKGAKWQQEQERMYSEEDMIKAICMKKDGVSVDSIIKQFKK